MRQTLDDFRGEFALEVSSRAQAVGGYTESSFFDVFTEYLIESGEVETADRCFFPKQGMRIDGYGGDPIDTDSILNVIVCDYSLSEELVNVNKSDIDLVCKRALKFISNCTSSSFRKQLEESSEAFGFADMVNQRWEIIQKVRIILLTNKSLSLRKAEFEPVPVNGIQAEFSCWDINRLFAYVNSGKDKEEISITLSEYGGAIAGLPAHQGNSPFQSYLCVMPGETLANIYEKWGTRLLEKNVRVFLQARVKVNRGIRKTLETAPEMFFAYNNGITATAEAISTELTEHGIALIDLHDFQIVNGGQTTASIFDAKRRGVNLENVCVQMKLSVVNQEKSKEIVPKISEYANSQNKVSSSDFLSNHPFHARFENFSRTVIAPPKQGTILQTKWFYERARGQYADARTQLGGTSERKKFDSIHPRNQLVTKPDLAKALNSFLNNPDQVSKGAQKNFTEFSPLLASKWDKDDDEHKTFNEQFYKNSIVKIILFKALEKIVSNQPWYQGGYRAQVVTYTLAKFNYVVGKKGKKINFKKLWNQQSLSKELEDYFINLSTRVYEHLIAPPPGSPVNVVEYAKKRNCWERFRDKEESLPSTINSFLVSKSTSLADEKKAESKQILTNDVDRKMAVIDLGGPFWSKVLEFSSQKNLLIPSDWSLLSRATAIPRKLPSTDKEYRQLLTLLERARKRGFEH